MSKVYKSKIKNFKYEIMLVVDGELSVDQARESISNLLDLFTSKENYKEKVVEYDGLAYAIKKKTVCHRFIINFEMDDSPTLAEFNRLALLNKNLLRYLVINETKDRSFRTRNNPKKVRDYEIRQEKRKQYIEHKKQQHHHSHSNAT